MKARIGAGAGSGLVHSVEGTAANVHGVTVAHELIRDDDGAVYRDSGCLGVERREEIKNKGIAFRISRKPSMLKTFLKDGGFNADRDEERRGMEVQGGAAYINGIFMPRRRGIEALLKTWSAFICYSPSRTS